MEVSLLKSGATAGVVLVFSFVAGSLGNTKAVTKPLQCWECMNYDQEGTYYRQCPMDDQVDPVRAYKGNCTGKCFTHTDDRNDKLVVRGCTGSQYGLPDPLPPDGCYPWFSEVWCVCSSDGCNGVALGTPETDKEFDAHIDYNKIAHPESGTRKHASGCTTILLPLVLLIFVHWL